MLCKACEAMFCWADALPEFKTYGNRPDFCVHETEESWLAAIAEGCNLCAFIWNKFFNPGIDHAIREENTTEITLQQLYFQQTYSRSLFKIALDISSPEGKTRRSQDIRVVPVRTTQDRLKIPGYEPTLRTDSEANLNVAKHWLTTCLTTHKTCKRQRNEHNRNWKPTRLIHISQDQDLLHLCVKDEIPDKVTYATLSHCWGKVEDKFKIVLTTANLSEWRKAIPSLRALKTFQDAIEISKRLGIWYIWIDSLCIVQDSKEDWEREAVQMSEVYKFSYCNISATSANDDTEGCFLQPENKYSSDEDASTSSESGLTGPSSGHKQKQDLVIRAGQYEFFDDAVGRIWRDDISNGAVNQRGWVVQERILAPRILHFTRTQLYWECTELQAQEVLPFGHQGNPEFRSFQFDSSFKVDCSWMFKTVTNESPAHATRDVTSSATMSASEKVLESWEKVLQTFTKGGLTYNSDRLVAISAIAREFRPLMRCRYLAGHWEAILIRSLAWTCEDNKTTRPKEYSAPSWSWASVDGEVVYPLSNPQTLVLVKVLEAKTELVTDDEMGQVKNGLLRLRGHLLQIDDIGELVISIEAGFHRYRVLIFWDDEIDHENYTEKLISHEDSENSSEHQKSRILWFLPLTNSFLTTLSGLLLAKIDGEYDLFRRVGYMEGRKHGFKEVIGEGLEPLIQLANEGHAVCHSFYENPEWRPRAYTSPNIPLTDITII